MVVVAVAGWRLLTVFTFVRLGVALARPRVATLIGLGIGFSRTPARISASFVGLTRGLRRSRRLG
jgi:hypothetical protein